MGLMPGQQSRRGTKRPTPISPNGRSKVKDPSVLSKVTTNESFWLFHLHTNQHLKLLSKYILFWTFVSFIWQKKEQMDVMNLQTNRRNCGRDTSTQNAGPCDVTSSQTNDTSISVLTGDTEGHKLWNKWHLFIWFVEHQHCDIVQWSFKEKNQSNSWILEFVFGRNPTNKKKKQTKCPPANIYVSLKCRR